MKKLNKNSFGSVRKRIRDSGYGIQVNSCTYRLLPFRRPVTPQQLWISVHRPESSLQGNGVTIVEFAPSRVLYFFCAVNRTQQLTGSLHLLNYSKF